MQRFLFLSMCMLGFLAQPSFSQTTMQFPVSRDVGIDAWESHNGYGGVFDPTFDTEEWNSNGAQAVTRAKKFNQHTIILDWDTDEINQWIVDNTNPFDLLSWTFNVYPQMGPINDVQILTIESENDWVEGDGNSNFPNFNWSEDTAAATQSFAQTYWIFDTDGVTQILDEDRSVPWVNDEGDEFGVMNKGDTWASGALIPNHTNSVDLLELDLGDAAFDLTFATVELDDELMDSVLNDENNRGILFGPLDGNESSNWKIFTRETDGSAPFLEVTVTEGVPPQTFLQPGDADQDLDFDQLDIVKVQISAKYLTGAAATWGEGDWDGAPGGSQGNPPAGNGFFDQIDIVSSLAAGKYLTGPYGALAPGGGTQGDEQTSLVYHADTGELTVDSPASKDLTSINITSAGSKFIGDKPAVLDGAFDNFAADNIFKATFGGSFGDISFGNVLATGLSEADVEADLTAVGSLAGGGDLGAVDLVYIPEPAACLLCLLGVAGLAYFTRRRR